LPHRTGKAKPSIGLSNEPNEKSFVGLTVLIYAALIGGAIGAGQAFFHQWRTGFVDPTIFGELVFIFVGICCSLILNCLKILDTRLTKIETGISSNRAPHQPN
jgi:hypothetical protein